MKHFLGKNGNAQIELSDRHHEFYHHENEMDANRFIELFTNKRFSSEFFVNKIILDNEESVRIKTPVKPEVNDIFVD